MKCKVSQYCYGFVLSKESIDCGTWCNDVKWLKYYTQVKGRLFSFTCNVRNWIDLEKQARNEQINLTLSMSFRDHKSCRSEFHNQTDWRTENHCWNSSAYEKDKHQKCMRGKDLILGIWLNCLLLVQGRCLSLLILYKWFDDKKSHKFINQSCWGQANVPFNHWCSWGNSYGKQFRFLIQDLFVPYMCKM